MNKDFSDGIRGSLQKYIITNIFNIVNFNTKILIFDDITEKIINSCITQIDLGNCNIFGSYKITDVRNTISTCPAIYFIEPTESNINLILQDWKNVIPENKYKSAYIFFSKKSGNIIMKLKSMRDNIKYICDLPICNFITPETLIFNLKIKNDFINFFAKKENERKISFELLNIFHCSKSIPEIINFNSNTSTIFADEFKNVLNSLSNETVNYTKNKSVLLILDRSYNFIQPLKKLYTYQSIIENYAGILKNNNIYERIVDRDGKKVLEKFILDDNDNIWTNFRHKHILECISEYNILKNNLDIKYPNIKKFIDNKKSLSLEQIGSTIREFTAYNKEKKLLSAHGDILKKVLNLYENNLKNIENLERKLYIKQDNSLLNEIEDIIKNGNLSYSNKCQLLIEYALTQTQNNNKIKNLTELANVDFDINTICTNINKNKNMYDLKNIIFDLLNNKLSTTEFTNMEKVSFPKQNTLLSSITNCNKFNLNLGDNLINLKSDKKIIIFIIGGMTLYEQSLAQKLTSEFKYEIIIGSTSIIDIDEYLMYLSSFQI